MFTSCAHIICSSRLPRSGNHNRILLVPWIKNLVVTSSLSYTPQLIYWEILLALPLKHDQNPMSSHYVHCGHSCQAVHLSPSRPNQSSTLTNTIPPLSTQITPMALLVPTGPHALATTWPFSTLHAISLLILPSGHTGSFLVPQ